MAELIEKELVFKIVGCALAVLNELGHGLREKTYERALCIELKEQGLDFSPQTSYPVFYRGQQIDDYIPDQIIDEHRGQLLNYLRITKLPVGVILNFRRPKLEWERLVLNSGR
ncbi:MAG: GxxExxY protein [Verrucomicrobia bacterium]|nr:MAG: GxxExxY protein [Verrucomicrobiota bacterium]